jgi:hypothetical protein
MNDQTNQGNTTRIQKKRTMSSGNRDREKKVHIL